MLYTNAEMKEFPPNVKMREKTIKLLSDQRTKEKRRSW